MGRLALCAVLSLLGCGGRNETPRLEAEPAPSEPSTVPLAEPVPPEPAEPAPEETTAVAAPTPPAPVAMDLDSAERNGLVDGAAPFDPVLCAADRIGNGPWMFEATEAATAGILDPARRTYQEELASVEHQRRIYSLVATPECRPPRGPLAREEQRLALWLVRLERRLSEDGDEEIRRTGGVRLYEQLVMNEAHSDVGCEVATELRARDLDADGEVELTVIVDGADVPYVYDVCGVLAFLVGGDDLNVQARFTRRFRQETTGVSGDTTVHDDATWIVRDVNADGHADLHVTQRWTMRDDWGGDEIDGDVFDAVHRRGNDRREVDCIYDAAADVWACPDVNGYRLGSRLFFTATDVADPRAARDRFEGPPWEAPAIDVPAP